MNNLNLDKRKFKILKALLSQAYHSLLESDDDALYALANSMDLEKDIDELTEDEYNDICDALVVEIDQIIGILKRSEKTFNYSMIF